MTRSFHKVKAIVYYIISLATKSDHNNKVVVSTPNSCIFNNNVVAVLTLTGIIKSVVTGQAPVTLELRNTPGKKHIQTKGGTLVYHSWRSSCLRQKHIKSEIGSQPTMCQVHTGAYVSLLAPGKPTIPLATLENLPRIYYT